MCKDFEIWMVEAGITEMTKRRQMEATKVLGAKNQ
jgi:hypothetical protein